MKTQITPDDTEVRHSVEPRDMPLGTCPLVQQSAKFTKSAN